MSEASAWRRGVGWRSSSQSRTPRMFASARSSVGATPDSWSPARARPNDRRRPRYRPTSDRVEPEPLSTDVPAVLATTRSPNAASRSAKDCSAAAMSMRSGGYAPVRVGCHHASMQIQFLGGATTVTGSQFLLTTDRARILIDCGMFQGSPNESIRNRIPFAFDPKEIDAVLLTHAHLDHCGLLPLLVKDGYGGKIHATAGTVELATLVLLDSGKLHEEFAKREARWEKRHPDKVAADDKREADQYEAAMALAATGEVGLAEDSDEAAAAAKEATAGTTSAAPAAAAAPTPDGGEHVPTSIEPGGPGWPTDPEAQLRAQPPHLDIDLDQPLYTAKDAERSLAQFAAIHYGTEIEVAPGIHATFHDAGHILGSAIIRLRIQETEGGDERIIVCSGDLGRPGTPTLRDPTPMTDADYVLVESTYGGREHEPEDEAIKILAETIRMVADAGGVLLVPSFAIGRT